MTRIEPGGAQQFLGSAEARTVLEDYFGRGWDTIDTWSQNAQIGTRGGALVTDQVLIPRHVRDRDQFFQEFCHDWDLGHYAAWTFDLLGQRWGYTLVRAHGHDYSPEDLIALEALRPAANRAALLACSFRAAQVQGIAEGLERSGRPSIVLDHRGHVVFATSRAAWLADQAFAVRNGLLVGLDSSTEAQLCQLRAAIRDRSIAFPAAFPMTSPGLARSVFAIPMPLRNDFFASFPGAHALLMLVDPEDRPTTTHDILRATFRMSLREADLAMLLGQGTTIAEAGARLGLKLSSVRQLAKTVLAKAGCSRQAELVALAQRLSVRTGPDQR